MYRRFVPHSSDTTTDAKVFSQEHTIGMGIIFVCPMNECDHGNCWHNEDDFKRRAELDVANAIECRKHGTLYAGMSTSMGVQDFTSQQKCDWVRKYYAPHYNSGLMGINYHSYWPNPNHIFEQFFTNADGSMRHDSPQIWYTRRWQFLFDKCGFINTGTNPVGIVSDEMGLDEGGIGGVPAHNLDGDYVRRATKRYITVQSLPVQGRPSPFKGGAWFQAGNTGRWAGYNIAPFIGDIARGNA
jgi:hypothetical protein